MTDIGGVAAGTESIVGPALKRVLRVLLPLVGAFVVICAVIGGLGANPFAVLGSMVTGSLGSQYSFAETLMVMMPLVLCGLAAAIPFSAGLWNIGGYGQLYVGSVAAVLVGLTIGTHVPGEFLSFLCIGAGVVAGSLWALIAAVVKITVGGNEVIVTLMLNLLAGLLADYVVTGPWAQGVSPQTRNIPGAAIFSSFWQSGFNVAFFVAIAVALFFGLFMSSTKTGFGIRASGRNLEAARLAGFRVVRLWLSTFGLGGACAGLAGALLVVAVHGALIPGMGEQYGYTGIAVALLAGLRPRLVIPAALFFAVVEVGGNSLSASANVSTAISYVIEGVIVIALLAFRAIRVRE